VVPDGETRWHRILAGRQLVETRVIDGAVIVYLFAVQ
jgi:hypothetical protein